MAAVRFHATSIRQFDDFRRELDTAIRVSRVADMLRHSWAATTMTISGPGSTGVLHFRDGRVHAEIRMTFPAIMMKRRVIADIRGMLEKAAGAPVAVTE
jgi:hypothetical protein